MSQDKQTASLNMSLLEVGLSELLGISPEQLKAICGNRLAKHGWNGHQKRLPGNLTDYSAIVGTIIQTLLGISNTKTFCAFVNLNPALRTLIIHKEDTFLDINEFFNYQLLLQSDTDFDALTVEILNDINHKESITGSPPHIAKSYLVTPSALHSHEEHPENLFDKTNEKNIRELSKLYADVYSLFTFRPELSAKVRGATILNNLRRALNDFLRENDCPVRCQDAIISWNDSYVGQQGRKLFQTHESLTPRESISHSNVEGPDLVLQQMTTYAAQLEENQLPSLTTLHQWAPSASFWVLGNPRMPIDQRHTTLTAVFEQFAKHADAIRPYPNLKRQLSIVDNNDGCHLHTPNVIIKYLDILTERYGSKSEGQEAGFNFYHVPQYGVDLAYNRPKGSPACLDFEAIVTFKSMSPHPCVHYLVRAIHLFLDLMSSCLFHHELRSSTSRLRVMQVEERSILHNLSYIFNSDNEVDRYVRSRLQYISQNGGLGSTFLRPVPLNTILWRLASESLVQSGLLKANIRGRVCVDPTEDNHSEIVLLPGGLSGINALRVILENIIRNAAKHASQRTIERLTGGTAHIKARILNDRTSIDRITFAIDVPLYDFSSIDHILNAYRSRTFLLNDQLEPNTQNMGSLEILLSCLSFLELDPELLIGESAVNILELDDTPGFEVYASNHRLLRIEKRSETTIRFQWSLLRSKLFAVASDKDLRSLREAGFDVLSSQLGIANGASKYMFIIADRKDADLAAKVSKGTVIPRVQLIDPRSTWSLCETVAELYSSHQNSFSKLWFSWRNANRSSWNEIVIIGARVRGDHAKSVLLHRFDECDVNLRFFEYGYSLTSDGAAEIAELLDSGRCAACLLHGAAIPLRPAKSAGHLTSEADKKLDDNFIDKRPCDYVVLGWKEGRDFPSIVDDLLSSDANSPAYEVLLANLIEHVEAWRYRVLVIDERSSMTFASRQAGDNVDSEGLPKNVAFQTSWSLLGVDIVYDVRKPGFMAEILSRQYDYYLIHDAFLRDINNVDECEILRRHLGDSFIDRVIVHSDGSTFSAAEPYNLFTQSWTGLASALSWGSKLQLILQISGSIRYTERVQSGRMVI